MNKKITQEEFNRIKAKRQEEEKAKAKKKEIDISNSSPAMTAAVQAAEAAVRLAEAAKDMTVKVTEDNKIFLTTVLEVMEGNRVTKLKVNRGKDKLMTSVDVVRG
jgi:hypothetical protein